VTSSLVGGLLGGGHGQRPIRKSMGGFTHTPGMEHGGLFNSSNFESQGSTHNHGGYMHEDLHKGSFKKVIPNLLEANNGKRSPARSANVITVRNNKSLYSDRSDPKDCDGSRDGIDIDDSSPGRKY